MSNKPLYTRIYYVNLAELLENPDKYINGKILPIIKVVDNHPNANETETANKAQKHVAINVDCPGYHVKSLIKFAPRFDEQHPCTILEYCGGKNPTITLDVIRILPTGAIVTNQTDFPNESIEKDFIHQVKKRQSWLFPTNHKHGH